MSDMKTEWEQRKINATQAWTAMSDEQQKALLTFMEAWLPIRQCVSEFMEISYEDLKAVDKSWYELRWALICNDVEVPHWP